VNPDPDRQFYCVPEPTVSDRVAGTLIGFESSDRNYPEGEAGSECGRRMADAQAARVLIKRARGGRRVDSLMHPEP